MNFTSLKRICILIIFISLLINLRKSFIIQRVFRLKLSLVKSESLNNTISEGGYSAFTFYFNKNICENNCSMKSQNKFVFLSFSLEANAFFLNKTVGTISFLTSKVNAIHSWYNYEILCK